jgi:hypothetical protein
MRHEKAVSTQPRVREMLAAWAFCGVVGLGGLLVDTGDHHHDPGTSVYTGVRFPGRGGSTTSALSIEDEFADIADDDIGNASNSAGPAIYSRQEVADDHRCWLSRLARRLL